MEAVANVMIMFIFMLTTSYLQSTVHSPQSTVHCPLSTVHYTIILFAMSMPMAILASLTFTIRFP